MLGFQQTMKLNETPCTDNVEDGVEIGMELTKQFYQILTDGNCYAIKKVQIVPESYMLEMPEIQQIMVQTGFQVAALDDSLTKTQEVIVSSKVMKKMFLECYNAIYSKPVVGDDFKIACVVILLITPNDTTIIRKLWSIVKTLDIKDIFDVLLVLGGFLTCNYDKTNKSSNLWTLFKKMILLINNNPDEYVVSGDLPEKMHDWQDGSSVRYLTRYATFVCLRSIAEHSRNYYACNSLRFFIKGVRGEDYDDACLGILQEHIKLKYDLSVWCLLFDAITSVNDKSGHYDDEAVRFGGVRNKTPCIGSETVIDCFLEKALIYGSDGLVKYISMHKDALKMSDVLNQFLVRLEKQ